MVRLLPKFGFTNNRFKTRYDIINVSDLNRFDSEVIPSVLFTAGLVGKKSLVKILAKGELKKALKVKAHRFSRKAVELIEKAGGTVEILSTIINKTPEEPTGKTEANNKQENISSDTGSKKGNDPDKAGGGSDGNISK